MNNAYAPYACFSLTAREYAEPEDPTRSPFQRDCQRIYHSRAFRRMQGKRQVLPVSLDDHIRTRLTHTLEVAQISRSLARSFRLNEDLAEAVALAHDLGHPPFGHAGERVFQDVLGPHGLHFEHNLQTLRIVTVLERRTLDYPGLNLTQAVRLGLAKHSGVALPLEAQIVDLADGIAYHSHDLEDALSHGYLVSNEIASTQFWQKYSLPSPESTLPIQLASMFIKVCVADLSHTLQARLHAIKPTSCENLPRLAEFSPEFAADYHEFREFLFTRYYQHPRVISELAPHLAQLKKYLELLLTQPELLSSEDQAQISERGLPQAICDYVAGMTDEFALAEFARRATLLT